MSKIIVQGFINLNDDGEKQGDVLIKEKASYFPIGLFEKVQNYITNKEGVASYSDRKRRLGHDISIINNCNIKVYYMSDEATLEEAENCLACVFDGKYYTDKDLTGYSEYTITGYKINECTIGGHDLVEEISSHVGQYIIFVLEW